MIPSNERKLKLGQPLGGISQARLDQWMGTKSKDPFFTTHTTDGSSTTTSPVINIGSPTAGQMVIIAFRNCGTATPSFPAGWTTIDGSNAEASDDYFIVGYRICDGTEGATITMSQTAAVRFAAVAFRFTHAGAPLPPNQWIIAVNLVGGVAPFTAVMNGGITPGRRNLFLAITSVQRDGGDITSDPSGYTSGGNFTNTGSSGAGLAKIQWAFKYAESNFEPSATWGIASNTNSMSIGLVIPPDS